MRQAQIHGQRTSVKVGGEVLDVDTARRIVAANLSTDDDGTYLNLPLSPTPSTVSSSEVRQRITRSTSPASRVAVVIWDRRYNSRDLTPCRPESPYPLPLTARVTKDHPDIANGRQRLGTAYAPLSISTSSPSLVRPSLSTVELGMHSVRDFISEISQYLVECPTESFSSSFEFYNDLELAVAHHKHRRYRASDLAMQRAYAKALDFDASDPATNLSLLAWLFLRSGNASRRHVLLSFFSSLSRRCEASFPPVVFRVAQAFAGDEITVAQTLTTYSKVIVDRLEAHPHVQQKHSWTWKQHLCRNLINQGLLDAARAMLDTMRYELSTSSTGLSLTRRLEMQLGVAGTFCWLSEYDTALDLVENAIQMSKEGGGRYDWYRADSLYWSAYCHYALGDLSSALRQACDARSIFTDSYSEEYDNTVHAHDLVRKIEREMWK